MSDREMLLARTFVEIADTLVDSFDIIDTLSQLTTRCVELFDVDQAALLLDAGEGLQVAASSSDEMQLLELFELQHNEGPCVDSYATGAVVWCEDLAAGSRWPRFTSEALRAGIGSVWAVPMRLREQTVGSLNLLRSATGALAADDLVAAQAVADIATISIMQHQVAAENRALPEQLRRALDRRVAVEQAKGIVAAVCGLEIDAAFDRIREYARNQQLLLSDVAEALVAHELDAVRLL